LSRGIGIRFNGVEKTNVAEKDSRSATMSE